MFNIVCQRHAEILDEIAVGETEEKMRFKFECHQHITITTEMTPPGLIF